MAPFFNNFHRLIQPLFLTICILFLINQFILLLFFRKHVPTNFWGYYFIFDSCINTLNWFNYLFLIHITYYLRFWTNNRVFLAFYSQIWIIFLRKRLLIFLILLESALADSFRYICRSVAMTFFIWLLLLRYSLWW